MRKFMNVDGGDEQGGGSQEETPATTPATEQPETTENPESDVPVGPETENKEQA